MPGLPETSVIGLGQFNHHGVGTGLQPLHNFLQIVQLHGRAPGGAIVLPSPNMEKDFVSGVGIRVVVIVLNENKPFVRKIIQMHVFLGPPIRERSSGREGIEMIVRKPQLGIVDPCIAIGDLMVRPAFGARRQSGGISHDEANFEKPHWVAAIIRFLLQAGLRRMKPPAPRQTAPAEHDRPRLGIRLPLPRIVPMEKLQSPFR